MSGDEAGAHAAGARKLARRPLNEDVFFAAASVAFSTDSAAAAEIFLLAFLDVVFFVFFGFVVVGAVGVGVGAVVFSPPPKRSPPNAPNACNICQPNTGPMNALFKITRAPSVSNP